MLSALGVGEVALSCIDHATGAGLPGADAHLPGADGAILVACSECVRIDGEGEAGGFPISSGERTTQRCAVVDIPQSDLPIKIARRVAQMERPVAGQQGYHLPRAFSEAAAQQRQESRTHHRGLAAAGRTGHRHERAACDGLSEGLRRRLSSKEELRMRLSVCP
jgi:hypothetical protein